MKFNLRRPCSNCPFRTDGAPFLKGERAQEIADALEADASFSCHKTNVRDDDGEVVDEPEHCAGAAIMLEHMERPNQWMRWMERLGFYDRRKLDMDAPVFESTEDFVNHHMWGDV